jgi:hypothetical protein
MKRKDRVVTVIGDGDGSSQNASQMEPGTMYECAIRKEKSSGDGGINTEA